MTLEDFIQELLQNEGGVNANLAKRLFPLRDQLVSIFGFAEGNGMFAGTLVALQIASEKGLPIDLEEVMKDSKMLECEVEAALFGATYREEQSE
jgi:fido (protein-threonine AMPylation protein)